MQGVTLLAGLAFLGSLAVPAGLLASEPATAPAPGETAPAPGETAPVAPDAEPEPAGPAYEPAPGAAPEADARASASRTVLMEDIEFKPRKIRIDPGDTVRWENRDEEKHDAIGEDGTFETPIIDQGETSSHTFSSRGKFPYFCSIHQGMTGTIQVGSSGGGGGGGSGGSGGASSGTGAIGTGGDTSGSSSGSGGTGGTDGFGASGASGTRSSLASTGSKLLWLGLIGYGLVALGSFVRLAAIGR